MLDGKLREGGAYRQGQRELVSALRQKAKRTLKDAVSEEFLAWLEGEADPLAAL